MAELETLLLEAAGRTNAGGRNRQSHPPSRRRREGSYSDGGSDSKDDSDEDRGFVSRKPSQVPLKKRLESSEREDRAALGEGGSDRDGDSSDESDFGDDLYKNEEDRQKLAGMTEFQREMILAERADKKGDKSFTEKLRLKRENDKTPLSKKETQPLAVSRGVRTSSRSADRAAAKDDALNELRAKRLKQQDPAAHSKMRDGSKGGAGSRDFSSIKRKPFGSSNLSSSSQSDSERSHSDDEGSAGGGMPDSDDDMSDVPTFEDIKEITIRRSKLAKWLMEPFFEELIVGCFVRVGIGRSKSGPIYRLCMVKNVDATSSDKTYKLENKTTHKYLNVVWGNDNSAARWQMAMVSDGHPLEEEYRQWVREVERTNGRMLTKQDVLEKKQAIQRTNKFVYSAETVKQMLQEKKSASIRPLNVAAEKDRLRRELDVAQSKNDEAAVARIKAKIKQLEASRQKKEVDKKALRLAEMNRKNRAENFKNASELKPKNTTLKAGEAGYDPFSRRWTRSRNYYAGRNNEIDKDGGENGSRENVAATEAALEAAADAGKLVDTKAPMDQGAEFNLLHNFELEISLASLQKYGEPQGVQKAFMVRKQTIEATVGCRVEENDDFRAKRVHDDVENMTMKRVSQIPLKEDGTQTSLSKKEYNKLYLEQVNPYKGCIFGLGRMTSKHSNSSKGKEKISKYEFRNTLSKVFEALQESERRAEQARKTAEQARKTAEQARKIAERLERRIEQFMRMMKTQMPNIDWDAFQNNDSDHDDSEIPPTN